MRRIGLDQPPDDFLELPCRLGDAQQARIDHGQVQRVRLAAKIHCPMIHPVGGKLWLLPRATQPRSTNIRRTIEQHDVRCSRRCVRCCSEDETRPCLTVQDGDADIFGKTAEPRKPLSSSCSLPLLAAAVVALHDLGGRHADRIEMETLHARNCASIERLDSSSFPGAGGTSHDE